MTKKDDYLGEGTILADTSIRYSQSENEIDEDDVIACIDDTLESVGKTIAYTIYLNWSAVDSERHLGILGDPQAFCDSLYSIFGDDNAGKIENLLVSRLKSRFPFIKIQKDSQKVIKSEFASFIVSLKHYMNGTSI